MSKRALLPQQESVAVATLVIINKNDIIQQLSESLYINTIYIYIYSLYYIFIYIIYVVCSPLATIPNLFHSSHMSWLEKLATGAALFRDLSSSLSCPVYCGSSIWLPLFLGLSLGLLLGLSLGLYLAWTFYLHRPQASSPARAFPKARSRLAGYLVDE